MKYLQFIVVSIVIRNATWCQDQRIFGGRRLKGADHVDKPYVAYLSKIENETLPICSGTIISRIHFLTAAHCFHNYTYASMYALFPNFKIVVGIFDIRRNIVGRPHIYSLVNITYPPDFSLNRSSHLKTDIVLAKSQWTFHMPFCHIFHRSLHFLREREPCIVYGWGLTKLGRRVTNVKALVAKVEMSFDHDSWALAKSKSKNGSICKGDSGGPVICSRIGRQVLVGIISSTMGNCTEKDEMFVITALAPQLGWISQIINAFRLPVDSRVNEGGTLQSNCLFPVITFVALLKP